MPLQLGADLKKALDAKGPERRPPSDQPLVRINLDTALDPARRTDPSLITPAVRDQLARIDQQNKNLIQSRGTKDLGAADVRIPGFTDLVTLGRNLYESDADAKARKIATAASIRDSTIPQWRQDMTGVMTKLDNIEDLLTTVGLAGRIALRYLPRLNPIVGTILAVDVVLNAAMALMRVPYPGSIKKVKLLATTKGNPYRGMKDAYRGAGALRKMPGIGTVAEVLQTTDFLFGQGLVIGPVFGAIEEAVARGTQTGLQAAQEGYLTPGQREAQAAIDQALGGAPPLTPEQIKQSNLPLGPTSIMTIIQSIPYADKAMRALEAFTGLARPNSGLPPTQKLDILQGGLLGSQIMRDAATQGVPVNLNPYLGPISNIPLPPTRRTDPTTLRVATAFGDAGSEAPRWDYAGNPELLDLAAYADLISTDVRAWLRELLEETAGSPVQDWVGAASETMLDNYLIALTGIADPADTHPVPQAKALGMILERGLAFPRDADLAKALAWCNATDAEAPRRPPFTLTTPELRASVARFGLSLESAATPA